MNMSKEEYHKRVNKMYSELRTDRVDADREEVIRCQRLYLAEDRYIPSCEREIERLNNIINELNYGIKELDDMFYETFRISQNGYYSISEWELKEFTDKLQELKGSDKE